MYINNIYKAQLSKLEGFYGRFKSLGSSGRRKKDAQTKTEKRSYICIDHFRTFG